MVPDAQVASEDFSGLGALKTSYPCVDSRASSKGRAPGTAFPSLGTLKGSFLIFIRGEKVPISATQR